jgi:hypothetical protein
MIWNPNRDDNQFLLGNYNSHEHLLVKCQARFLAPTNSADGAMTDRGIVGMQGAD